MACTIRLLGGADEVGASALLLEAAGTGLVIDFGRRLATGSSPVYQELPPDAVDRCRGIFLTHAHLDHTGSLPLLGEALPGIPVWADPVTAALCGLVEEGHRPLVPWQGIELPPFRVIPFPVHHSVPGSCGFIVECADRTLVVSGDFTFPDHADREPWSRVAAACPRGIDLFLCDGTGLTRPQAGTKECELPAAILSVFRETAGDVWATCFSSNWHRLRLLCEAAMATGRSVQYLGRSMARSLETAVRLSWPGIADSRPAALDGRPGPKLVLVAGTQGEGESAFARLSCEPGRVRPEDSILYSAGPVPGNELAVRALLDRFAASTRNICAPPLFPVHASGHAARPELQDTLQLLQPRTWIPVHTAPAAAVSAFRGDLAADSPRVLLVSRGAQVVVGEEVVVAAPGAPSRTFSAFPPARERIALLQEGFLSLTLLRRGAEFVELLLFTRGFVDRQAEQAFLEELRCQAAGCAEEALAEGVLAAAPLAARLRSETGAFLYSRTGCRPELVVQVVDLARLL